MAKKKQSTSAEFVLFNVVYDDGTQSSNRRVPADVLGGLDGDEPARAIIEEQDRRISDMSGRPRSQIKSVTRASDDAKAAKKDAKGKDAKGKDAKGAKRAGR